MSSKQVSISWQAATGSGTGYNIYLVNGAPPNSTKTFLVFNNGLSNTHYTYPTPVDDNVDLQFEVRTTDGTYESDPLEIFYPNGETLWTPTKITPTGQPQMLPRDIPYLTKDEYILYPNGLKLTTSSALYVSGVLDTILQIASEEVNRYCRRHFQMQTIDEVFDGVRINQDSPKLISIPLNEQPIQNVIRIDLQVLQWFIQFSLDYLQVFSEKGYIQIVPFLGGGGGSAVPLPAAVLTENILAKVWIRYTAGFDSIPSAVKMATAMFATKMIGLQENPVSAYSVKFGRNFSLQWDSDVDPIINKAHQLLDPYILFTFRRP